MSNRCVLRTQRDDNYAMILLTIKALLIRNRLAVRIAGSHLADRGSIPRYGSNNMVSDRL